MRRTALLTVTVVAWVGMACAASTPHQAATVPQPRLFDSLHTIALDPITAYGLPADLRRIDLGRGKFDSLITAELSHAGYRVVPAAESQAIWDRLADSLGGLFDRASGQIDSVRLTTVRARTLRELRERFHVDAWLHPVIVMASAKFKSGTAKWDGTKQVFGKKFLGLNLESGYGTTPALSLDVIIETTDGKVQFKWKGGLQLSQVPSDNGFVRIPDSQVYADQERNVTAVRLALAPLLAGPPATTAASK